MKLSVILTNLLLIDAVAFIDSSMMTAAAAAAILVSIRPSQVMLLFTSHHIIFQKTVDETSQPHPFFSIIILTLSKAEEEPEASTSAPYALYCHDDEVSIFDRGSFQSELRVMGDSARPKIQLRAWQGSGEDGT